MCNTYHHGHNCETHCRDEYPHPKKRDIAWQTVSFLQQILIVHMFSQSLQAVEMTQMTLHSLLTVSWSEQLKSHLSPIGSRTANFISFPSIWLICEQTRQDTKKRKWVMRREIQKQSCHLHRYHILWQPSTKSHITKNKVLSVQVYFMLPKHL